MGHPSSPEERAEVLALLPHGRAFRFIDEIAALEPGTMAVGHYTIRGDEPFLEAHFPGNPILPGVVLVEAIAQLAGVVAQCDPNHEELPDLRLAAIRQAKITGTAAPRQLLTIEAHIDGRLGNLVQARGTVTCDEHQLASASVTLSGG